MADDLDGVSAKASVAQYDPGPQYRVKEMDPDEAGGGKDFYDGFLRQKRRREKDKPEDEGEGEPAQNPIPVVPHGAIHDDVKLSSRARSLLDREVVEEEDRPEDRPAPASSHLNIQA